MIIGDLVSYGGKYFFTSIIEDQGSVYQQNIGHFLSSLL
tara:strand:+ start:172 stop:288 length:117 start_codon:yes stop_codon:yes gene_type:complete